MKRYILLEDGNGLFVRDYDGADPNTYHLCDRCADELQNIEAIDSSYEGAECDLCGKKNF